MAPNFIKIIISMLERRLRDRIKRKPKTTVEGRVQLGDDAERWKMS